jgi:hypothetical protein
VVLEPEIALGYEFVERDGLRCHERRGRVLAPARREDGGQGLGLGCVRAHACFLVCVACVARGFYVGSVRVFSQRLFLYL